MSEDADWKYEWFLKVYLLYDIYIYIYIYNPRKVDMPLNKELKQTNWLALKQRHKQWNPAKKSNFQIGYIYIDWLIDW